MKKIAMILLVALLVLNTFACTVGSEKQAVNQPQDLEKRSRNVIFSAPQTVDCKARTARIQPFMRAS